MFSAFLTGPDWQRDAPVALTRYHPVSSPFKPAVEPLGPGPFRHPSNLPVLAQHSLLDGSHLDKPLVCCSKDEGCFAPPAVRVRVLDRFFFPEKILGLEVFDDHSVRVSD